MKIILITSLQNKGLSLMGISYPSKWQTITKPSNEYTLKGWVICLRILEVVSL